MANRPSKTKKNIQAQIIPGFLSVFVENCEKFIKFPTHQLVLVALHFHRFPSFQRTHSSARIFGWCPLQVRYTNRAAFSLYSETLGFEIQEGEILRSLTAHHPKKEVDFPSFSYIYIYLLPIHLLTMISNMTSGEKNLLLSVYSFVFLLGFMSVGLVAGHWGEILCGQGRRIWHEENVAWRLQIQRSNGDTEKHPQLLRFRILHLVLQGSEQAMPSRSRRKVTWASHIRDRGDETPTVPADDIHWLNRF